MAILTADEAKARAIALAGSDDFGPAGFEVGLERTLDAFARLPLTERAAAAAMDKTVADLANRLRIEQWYRDHPEIEDQEIEGPVLVCGLPRTGTTATVGMMATDPRYRFLRGWEAMSPVPPPEAGKEEDDPRAVSARKVAQEYASQQSQHIMDPDGPEEDLVMLAPLNMHAYNGAYPMPDDYIAWWSDADFASTYAYHRRVLKLLQSRRPPHLWLLKAPVQAGSFRRGISRRQIRMDPSRSGQGNPVGVQPAAYASPATLRRRLAGQARHRAKVPRFLGGWHDPRSRGARGDRGASFHRCVER